MAKKNINPKQAWLEKALSGDETRENLCYPFRESGKLIATDGHRMHCFESAGVDGYLIAADLQAPTCKQVFDALKPQRNIVIQPEIRDLKVFAKAVKDLSGQTCGSYLSVKNKDLYLIHTNQYKDMVFQLRIADAACIDDCTFLDPKTGVNPQFLLDALDQGTTPIKIEDCGHALRITGALGTAIVMGMRL